MTQPTPRNTPGRGLIHEIGLEANLFMKLMTDRRVSVLLKLIPIAGLLYAINPVDFPGPLDDIVVLVFSLVIFLEVCPRAVVSEHRKNLRQVIPGEWHDAPREPDVIEGKFRDAEDQDQGVHRDK
jgi:uncharacterized membrane protein YkvA (DUF1232 family)